jgi:microcystin-dependent protein
MTQDFSSLRSTEDIINALSTLYFNLNEIERIYYDMFINPVPMDVTFQRYDDTGKLETITLPNRAKDAQATLTGVGDPNGAVSASVGSFYLDTSTYNLYYKSSGSDSQGWILLWSGLNLVEGTNYLAPNGDGSQLTNLNMTNAGSGILNVLRGGTGSAGITGVVKGNGSSPMTAAVDGVDYLGVSSMTGLVAYYPVATIPVGWLRCDGSAYSRTTYANLFAKIGTTYGAGDGTTTFNVPNLMNDGNGNPFFIRCWDGSTAFNTVQQAQVGVHNHPLTGDTGEESAHTHTRGTMNITGSASCRKSGLANEGPSSSGALYITGGGQSAAGDGADGPPNAVWNLDASRAWTGETSGGSAHSHSLSGLYTSNNSTGTASNENRVLNKMMVPVIKY